MRNWYIESNNTQSVGILLFPRFSNHCLANAVEPLRAINELAQKELYSWQFLTIDGQPIESSSGLPVLPARQLCDHPGGDYLFLLPSYDVATYATHKNVSAIRAAASRFRNIIGMDTGAWLLAAAGLLDGRKATIHWHELTSFAETFDQISVVTERIVIDGNIQTCGGAMTAFDLVLEMIRHTHGEALRLEVASFFLTSLSKSPLDLFYHSTESILVDQCISLMSAHLETPIPVQQVAQKLGISQRKLSVEFKKHLGATPQSVYKRLRLLCARRFAMQTGYSIAEIAFRSGYQNPAAMTRAFAQEFGVPPTAYRNPTINTSYRDPRAEV